MYGFCSCRDLKLVLSMEMNAQRTHQLLYLSNNMINFESFRVSVIFFSSQELSFNSSYQLSITITQLVATPTNHQIRQSWLSQLLTWTKVNSTTIFEDPTSNSRTWTTNLMTSECIRSNCTVNRNHQHLAM